MSGAERKCRRLQLHTFPTARQPSPDAPTDRPSDLSWKSPGKPLFSPGGAEQNKDAPAVAKKWVTNRAMLRLGLTDTVLC
ncbi:hypothetical protein CRUP_036294 [Coryphaenoides rupestris]|nr:hypothetical protein CRUP_036294 [Coryphaenoides rupestris]